MTTALLIGASLESMRTALLPVARAAYQRFGTRSVLVGVHLDQLSEELLECNGVRFVDLHERPEWALPAGGSRGLLNPIHAIRLVTDFWQWKRAAAGILDRYRPDAIFNARMDIADVPFLNKLAVERGIPTIRIVWTFAAPWKVRRRHLERNYQAQVAGLPGPVRKLRLARRNASLWVTKVLYRWHGIDWQDYQIVNARSVFATSYAITNRMYIEQFIADGLPEDRLVCTGHPEDDLLFDYRRRFADPQQRLAARREFQVDQRPYLVTIAREYLRAYSYLDKSADMDVVRLVLRTVLKRDDTQVVLKLHPQERLEDYGWVAEEFPSVKLLQRCDFHKLVTISDCFLSQGSNTTRWAVVAGVPVILIDFLGLGFAEHVSRVFAVSSVRTLDELAERMNQVLSGKLVDETERIRQLAGQSDGKAVERILDLSGLETLARAESAPAAVTGEARRRE